MRLIDADALINVLKDPPVHASLCGMTMADVLLLVEEAPTIDAEPVRHGRWDEVQFRTIPHNRISKAKKCSECGKRKDKYVTWIYCPNCGAKMDGGTA